MKNDGRFKLGSRPWNKGLQSETNETVARMVKNLMPFRLGGTPWNKGKRKENDARVMSISRNMTGEKNPAYGKHPSETTKVKLRERHAGMTGKNHSDATKLIISKHRRHKNCGKENPNWKGGKTSLYFGIRQLPEYKDWQMDVFKRDNFTCVSCHQVGGWLEVHHIKPFKEILKEYSIQSIIEAQLCKMLWARYNGVTLCKSCHAVIDPWRMIKGKRKIREEVIENV